MNPRIPRGIKDAPESATRPADRLTDPNEQLAVISCPSCMEKTPEKIQTRNAYWGIVRHCLSCGNEWSGGNMALGTPDHSVPLPAGVPPPPEDDIPPVQYLGGPHRFGIYEED